MEEDLLTEKYKIKKISDDLNQTFEDMINMSVEFIVRSDILSKLAKHQIKSVNQTAKETKNLESRYHIC